jgi:MFS family permease
MVLIANPVWVFFCRTLDRLGKGVRTGARDAILSAEATPATKGRIFGFHRGMDTLGAAIGPFLALVYLNYFPHKYTDLFLIAFLPGVLAVALTFFLKEKNTPKEKPESVSLFDFVHYWRSAHPSYRATVTGLLFFTLINSSDVFLLLMVKEHGFSDQYVIGAYIFYNLVYALLSYPAGKLGDNIGLRKTFLIGIGLFIAAYALMAFATSFALVIAVFFIYGIYAAMTEGISKAWITNLCDAGDTATAVGTYTAFSSIATMVASAVAGVVWFAATPPVLFCATAVGGILVVIFFLFKTHEFYQRTIA